MSNTNKWNALAFFPEAERRLETEQCKALRAVFSLFKKQGEKVVWGSKVNSDGGFQFGFCKSDPIVHGYATGDLHFYTRKFNSSRPYQVRCRQRLESFLQREFDAKVDNPDHFELKIDAWAPRAEILLKEFRDLLSGSA